MLIEKYVFFTVSLLDIVVKILMTPAGNKNNYLFGHLVLFHPRMYFFFRLPRLFLFKKVKLYGYFLLLEG